MRGSCDVASTGGPSSLSTLLCPLVLRVLGFIVPKIGVPGRPAGAVDVLSLIPGYRISYSNKDFASLVAKEKYGHALAGDDLAPLDAQLFSLRKKHNAVAVGPLVIASLLAKKIAAGIEKVVLDVRVWPYGNFGRNHLEAKELASRFCRVASFVEIDASCVLTDAARPYQPYIGRGESLLALDEFFYGNPSPWLQEHAELCRRIAAVAVNHESSGATASRDSMCAVFESNLEAQGSSCELFRSRVAEIASEASTILACEQDGFVVPDLQAIRRTIVEIQTSTDTLNQYSDPLGVRLLVTPDTFASRGTPIALVRHGGRPRAKSRAVLRALSKSLQLQLRPPPTAVPITVVHSD